MPLLALLLASACYSSIRANSFVPALVPGTEYPRARHEFPLVHCWGGSCLGIVNVPCPLRLITNYGRLRVEKIF